LPSPTGDGKGRGNGGHGQPGHGSEDLLCFTGKISGLIFDHFGNFEGFLLDEGRVDRKFLSRETGVAELVERAWRERLRITVCVERDEHTHRPPLSFGSRQFRFHDRIYNRRLAETSGGP